MVNAHVIPSQIKAEKSQSSVTKMTYGLDCMCLDAHICSSGWYILLSSGSRVSAPRVLPHLPTAIKWEPLVGGPDKHSLSPTARSSSLIWSPDSADVSMKNKPLSLASLSPSCVLTYIKWNSGMNDNSDHLPCCCSPARTAKWKDLETSQLGVLLHSLMGSKWNCCMKHINGLNRWTKVPLGVQTAKMDCVCPRFYASRVSIWHYLLLLGLLKQTTA